VKFDMSVSMTSGATALTDATRAESRGEILHQRVDGTFGAGICGQRAERRTRAERRQEHDIAAVPHDRQQLLHQKITKMQAPRQGTRDLS